MPQIRIALAQINPVVGDLDGNTELVLARSRAAVAAGAHAVVFPELAVNGYPVEDMALRESFAQASRAAVDTLAARLADAGCGDIAVFVGHLDRDDAGPRNAAAVLFGGRVVARQFKHHLPNYGVFDERRYFVPGHEMTVVRLHGVDIGMVICEDLWQDGGPIAALTEAGVGLVVALNASPFERGKDDVRWKLVARRGIEARAPICYVNMVGGQDELVFDGASMVVGADGSPVTRAPRFTSHLHVVDIAVPSTVSRTPCRVGGIDVRHTVLSESPVPVYLARPAPPAARPLTDLAQTWAALVVGLGDYVRKNGFASAILGLSGGIDSAVVAALAVDAIGADNVYGVAMPSAHSSEHSLADAADLATRTGLHHQVRAIDTMVSAFVGRLGLSGLAEENIQARCRALILMGLSNQDGHLVLATGNKSELAVGYSTIYGDAVGGFAPIKDIPKTQVWQLARWRNELAAAGGETPPIPPNSIDKPPSAELRPGQLDTDSLPDYHLLDRILDHYVEGDQGYRQLVAAGFDPELVQRVLRMVDGAEYKRRQYPPGTKISMKAFGRDRRLPITNRWREH